MRIRSAILVSALLALGAVAGAQANKTKNNKADQATAVGSLLKLGELPAPFTWKGGKVAAGSAGGSSFNCKGFKPKSSDLVTTGNASATFTAQGVQLQDHAEVLQTAKMVSDDFGRTFIPALVPCLETTFEHNITGLVVLKAGRVTFPQLAKYAAAYRIVFKITPKGAKTEEGVVDFIALAAGRKELSLLFTAILGTASDVASGEKGMDAIDLNLSTLLAKNALGAKPVA